MIDIEDEVLFTIPSTRRPDNVELMSRWYPHWTWVVEDKKDKKDYEAAGAKDVFIKDGEGLRGSRNTCVELALSAGKLCLQVDDDLQNLYRATGQSTGDREPINIYDAVKEVVAAMWKVDAALGSVLSTDNPFYSSERIHTWAFCAGQFIILDPEQPEWWEKNPSFQYKDDWELTLRHLERYHKVVRVDYILPNAINGAPSHGRHGGKGGLNATRNIHTDVGSARAVLARYPELVRKNPRRVGELLLRHNIKTMPDHAKEMYRILNA